MEQQVNNKEQQQTANVVKTYDNAHLVMYCGKCKSKYVLEENITKNQGVNIALPPTSEAQMRLVCKECGNEMGLFYIEAKLNENVESGEVKEVAKEEESEQVSENTTSESNS